MQAKSKFLEGMMFKTPAVFVDMDRLALLRVENLRLFLSAPEGA